MQSPSNFEATNNLALALVELKDDSKKNRALEYASENFKKTQGNQNKQNPQNVAEAVSTFGWVLYRIDPVKNLDDADKLLRQAISTNALQSRHRLLCRGGRTGQQTPERSQGPLGTSHEDYRSLDDEDRGQSVARTIEQEVRIFGRIDGSLEIAGYPIGPADLRTRFVPTHATSIRGAPNQAAPSSFSGANRMRAGWPTHRNLNIAFYPAPMPLTPALSHPRIQYFGPRGLFRSGSRRQRGFSRFGTGGRLG